MIVLCNSFEFLFAMLSVETHDSFWGWIEESKLNENLRFVIQFLTSDLQSLYIIRLILLSKALFYLSISMKRSKAILFFLVALADIALYLESFFGGEGLLISFLTLILCTAIECLKFSYSVIILSITLLYFGTSQYISNIITGLAN